MIILCAMTLSILRCNNEPDVTTGGKNAGTTNTTQESMVPRDRSINQGNSYNDIFLDSNDVEAFIANQKLSDTIARDLRNFYNARNYEYSWFSSTGLAEQAYNFHSLSHTDNENTFSKSLERRLDRLRVPDDSVVHIDPKDASTIKTELEITEQFIRYAMDNYKNSGPNAAELGTYIPAKKEAVTDMASSVLANNDKNKTYDAINEPYKKLKERLKQYADIASHGGWPAIPEGKKTLKKGTRSPEVAIIKKRLQMTGELPAADTSDVYDAPLQQAVKAYQQSHGYQPTGEITAALIKDMNVPALTRLQQLLINLQRMQWMPANVSGRLILVNIPEFQLYVDSGNNVLFPMAVVVGAEGHNTTMFSGNLSEVVFSPYWNIPPSIVKKEILPAMERNKHYLAEKGIEITGQEDGLPVMRQPPGPKNPLGKVKFVFPNSFDIYLHDTPDKGLFAKRTRDASHGCIRLADARKLAIYLLQGTQWTADKIDAAMNSGNQQFVKVPRPVPVLITYYTAWVDNNNTLHFADDIYGHDSKMADKMFTNPQREADQPEQTLASRKGQ